MNIYTISHPDIRQKISAAVAQAEKETEGEIVPMVVSESDEYTGASWRFGIFFGFATTFAFLCFSPLLESSFYLIMAVAMTILGHFMGQIPFFKRWALWRGEVEEEVFKRALAEFQRHKVGHTKNQTGILLFVSLLERRVILLADENIHRNVPEGTWKSLVDDFIKDIKAKKVVEGFCKAIKRCGEILTAQFPLKKEYNPNELPNCLIVKP